MTLICIKYWPTSGGLSVNCCLFGEKRKFLPIGCAGLVCTLVHMSIMRNTGGKMHLRQQNVFALSWLIVVTWSGKWKDVNCLILECLFQAICSLSYVQYLFIFRHMTGRPAGHFLLNA